MSIISRWFTQEIKVSRRDPSPNWQTESVTLIGTIKGFVQPISGTLRTDLGRVAPNATHRLYCPFDDNLLMGDLLEDEAGQPFVVLWIQVGGIAGTGDHMEALLERK